MSNGPYSRIYHELAEDYPEVYDGPLLADFTRLLVASDQAYPVRARWAGLTTRRNLSMLASIGSDDGRGPLVTIDGPRYSVKGAEKEREARASKARRAAVARHSGSSASGTARSSASSSAQSVPSLETSLETRRAETSRMPGASDDDPLDPIWTYNQLTARSPSKGAMDWLDRLGREYGDERVSQVMGVEWQRDSDLRTFLGRVEAGLATAARKANQADEEKRRRSAIEEQRELERRLASATPEERARAEQLRDSIGAFVKGFGS